LPGLYNKIVVGLAYQQPSDVFAYRE